MKYLALFFLFAGFCNFNMPANASTLKTHWNKYEQKRVTVNDIISNKIYLNLSKFDHLLLKNISTDELGIIHHIYTQTHKKTPVENTMFVLHEKNGAVSLINGNTAHNFETKATASINETEALKIVLDFVDAKLYAWEDEKYEHTLCKASNNSQSTFHPVGNLVWYRNTKSSKEAPYKLSYKFDIYSIKPHTRQYIYVDANNGNIIESINRIANCTNTLATGETNYYNTVSFSACKENGTYHLKNIDDTHIEVFDKNNEYAGIANEITNTDSHFETNKAANEVFWTTQKMSEYFKSVFNRNSIDNNGMPMLSWVNYANRFSNKNDAFWNGNWVILGGGDGENYHSLTSADIVAHEMMHGITEYSANLIYQDEPGALNESFSDIFGEVIEAYTTGKNDWMVGAEIMAGNKKALRNLKNPKDEAVVYQQPDTYNGSNWWTDIGDNGGVHYNSGVQNFWFYLLTEGGSGINDNNNAYTVEPIGIDKAAAIAYRNLSYYLTPFATYVDAKNGAIQAAIDLFGNDSFEARQTELAWQAVGVGAQKEEPQTIGTCRKTDSLTLVKIHENLKAGPTQDFWPLDEPIDTWDGIELNENGCVEYFSFGPQDNLSFYNSIPAAIGDLKSLKVLQLSHCNLTGEIPKEIGNLTELDFLSLGNNQLQGNIPNELAQLEKLTALHLGNNNLYGNIPFFVGEYETLSWLELNDNELAGEIPVSFGNSNINLLNIGYNNLSGCFQPELNILCDQLDPGFSFVSEGNIFDATWEDFCSIGAGVCPPTENCRQTDSLTLVKIHEHLKAGPTQDFWPLNEPIDNWNGITLNENGCVEVFQFGPQDNLNFNTSIPATIADLKSLKVILLSYCNLTGEIPLEIGNLSELDFLSLNNNQLEGNIPNELAQLEKLNALHLGNNNLYGSIPYFIGEFENLSWLELNDNQLTGKIPVSFGNSNINLLNIGNNSLSGCYEAELSNLCNQLDEGFPTIVSEGNNFETTWADFCSTGTGVCPPIENCRQTDSLTLLKIGENLKNYYGEDIWQLNEPLDDWYGITLNDNGCVKGITFIETGLLGFLSSEIGDLKSLETLLIIDCELSGEIPKEIGNLTELKQLSLSSNNLQGEIPNEIIQLTKLTSISLGSNNLTGGIPVDIGNLVNLTYIDAGINNLEGTLPSSLANLTNMHALSIEDNNLRGCFPPQLSTLCNQITNPQAIDTGNNFDATWEDFCNIGAGVCPPTENCRQTDSLTLVKIHEHLKAGPTQDFWPLNEPMDNWNGITLNENGCVEYFSFGPQDNLSFYNSIPAAIGDLKSLKALQLSHCNLTGEIPAEIGNLTELDFLSLGNNQLQGNIPNELAQLEKLTALHLGNNNLFGRIPLFVGEYENLSWLELNDNELTGEIPVSFGNSNINLLNIGYNNLSGCYQPELSILCDQLDPGFSFVSEGNIFDATWGDFCSIGAGVCPPIESCRQTDSLTLVKIHKGLKGEIGQDFWDFSTPIDTWQGITLNIDGCVDQINFNTPGDIDFKGYIPAEIGELISLTKLSFINCNIGGKIPREIGNLVKLQSLSLYGNQLEGEIPIELLQLKKLGILNLHSNNLSGSIPNDIGQLSNLIMISFFNNNLTGNLPLSIANLDKLNNFYVDANNLSGCYKLGLKSLCNQLSYPLIDQGNNFDATWDEFCNTEAGACTEIENCRQTDSLTLLKIHEHFKGESGTDFWPLNKPIDTWDGIELNEQGCVIWLQISKRNFNTTLPIEISDLENLEIINITDCNLTGSIPKQLAKLAELQVVMLSNNQLEGKIPGEFGEVKNFEILELNNNNLEGSIPASLAGSELYALNFANNNLSGCYEPELEKLCDQLFMEWPSIIDEGNSFDATWEDFCNTDSGRCLENIETVTVWPGDMDNNGIVNSNDLLFYGLAAERTGKARENTSTQWQAEESIKWNNIVAGVNSACQDANGNGIVDQPDVDAIMNNYGKSNIISESKNTNSPLNLQLKLQSSFKYAESEELVYNLYAKNNAGGTPNIYGLSTNINFSDLPVKEIKVDFSQSSLIPTEHLSYFNTTTGVLDLSLTRTNKTNIEVEESVARIIVVIDDFPTGDSYKINVAGGSFSTVGGGLNGIQNSIFYTNHNTNQSISNILQVYVNTINQQCDSKGSASAIINGGIAPYKIKWNNGSQNNTLNNLGAGAYSIYVTDAIGNTAQVNFIVYGSSPVYNETGTLVCGTACPDYLSPTTTLTNRVFKSAQIINAGTAYTQKQTIDFKAGDTISLDKGFYIGPEVDFSATIEQCE